MIALPLAAAVCLAGQAPAGSISARPDLRCGAYCLYVGLKAIGRPVESFAQLEQRLGQPSPLGYSMAQLAEVAESYGASTLTLRTTLENLRRRPGRFACIALLRKSNHFVCVYDADSDSVRVVDPPDQKNLPAEVFRDFWTGEALLVADRPLAPLGPEPRWDWIAAGALAGTLAVAGFVRRRSARRREET